MSKRIGFTTDKALWDCATEQSRNIFIVVEEAIASKVSLDEYDFILTDWYALRATLVDGVREMDNYNA